MHSASLLKELAHKDSNLEMTESESAALPFGYGPTTDIIVLFLWKITSIYLSTILIQTARF